VRGYRVDVHVVRPELARHGTRERDHCALRGSVHEDRRVVAALAGDGGHVDDLAVVLLLKDGSHGADGVEDPFDVDGQGTFDDIVGGLLNRARQQQASVVDEYIDGVVSLDRAPHQHVHLLPAGDVVDNSEALPARRPDLRHGGLEQLLLYVGDHDPGAFRG